MLFLSSTMTGLCATLLMMQCTALPLDSRQAPTSLPFASSSNILEVIRLAGRHDAAYPEAYGVAPLNYSDADRGLPVVKVKVGKQDVVLFVE